MSYVPATAGHAQQFAAGDVAFPSLSVAPICKFLSEDLQRTGDGSMLGWANSGSAGADRNLIPSTDNLRVITTSDGLRKGLQCQSPSAFARFSSATPLAFLPGTDCKPHLVILVGRLDGEGGFLYRNARRSASPLAAALNDSTGSARATIQSCGAELELTGGFSSVVDWYAFGMSTKSGTTKYLHVARGSGGLDITEAIDVVEGDAVEGWGTALTDKQCFNTHGRVKEGYTLHGLFDLQQVASPHATIFEWYVWYGLGTGSSSVSCLTLADFQALDTYITTKFGGY